MKKYKSPSGLSGGLTNYGDRDFSLYLRRSFAKSMGYTGESLNKPIVGICYTESGFNNCHRHFPELLEAVKRGINASGALPLVFPVISLGEVFLSPCSLMYRNLMAMDTEEMIHAQPMDSVVLMGGCDKTVPALLMGAISAGKPAVLLVAGPMMTGRYRGQKLGACTDCRRFWGQYRSGDLDKTEISKIEDHLAVTAGTCAVMGTASTMALMAETLGMMLPNSSTIPAVHAGRLRVAEQSGILAARMAFQGGPVPADIITAASLRNALKVLLAVSGSTNAILHLAAIAGRLGLDIDYNEFNRFSDSIPTLANLKPTGEAYMEDFHHAGGLGAILHELAGHLETEVLDLNLTRLSARLSEASRAAIGRDIIHEISPQGGLIILSGSLAPQGAILKRAAATPELLEHEGRAVVFSSLEDLAKRIDEPSLDVRADDILVLQHAGPSSASAMPEAGCLPIPKKLAKRGVKDMVRISDARMSGTAFGTIVLHVTPEANLGGPLALVKNGDIIRLSASSKRIDLLVSAGEMESRRKNLLPRKPDYERGYKHLYQSHVLPAPLGCDFDFLRAKEKPGKVMAN